MKNYTINDLRKGLMLAGCLSPLNGFEQDEKDALEAFEKYGLKAGDKTQYGTIEKITLDMVWYSDSPTVYTDGINRGILLSSYTAFPSKSNKEV